MSFVSYCNFSTSEILYKVSGEEKLQDKKWQGKSSATGTFWLTKNVNREIERVKEGIDFLRTNPNEFECERFEVDIKLLEEANH